MDERLKIEEDRLKNCRKKKKKKNLLRLKIEIEIEN